MLAFSAFALIASATFPCAASAQSLTIQGKVLDGTNAPVDGPATQFRVQILTPDSHRCVLYDETRVVDLSATNGLFSINLNDGLGTVTAPSTYTLEQALSNRAAFSVASTYCASGSGTVTYTPGTDDNRKVVIQFRDPASMASFETIPEMDLNPVAWAMESRSAGGFAASSLLRVVAGGAPGSAPALTAAEVGELQNLVAGTSTKYMGRDSSSGATLPSFSGNPPAPGSGSIWFDSSGSGAIKFKDTSGTIQTIGTGSGAGTITSVTGNNGLTASTTSGAVTVGMQAISPTSPAGDYGSASSVPVIRVDAYGRVTQAGSATITGVLPTGATGEFLKYSAGAWGSAAVRMSDIKNATGAAALFGSTTCSASETFYWDSGTDQFKCQSIALGAPSTTVAATYTKVTVAADGRVNGGSATVGNSDIADLAWSKLTSVPNLVTNGGSASSLVANDTGSKPAGQIAGRIYVDVSNQKISYDNGTAWVDVSGSASATPSVSVSAPLTSTAGTVGITQASGSTDGYLSSVSFTAFTNKLSKALASAHIFVGSGSGDATDVAVSGDLSLANTGAFTVNAIRGTPVTAAAATAGQVLRYDGSTGYAPSLLSLADIRSNVTGSSTFTTTCSAGQTLTWNSGSDTLQCQNISVAAASQISGTLGVANGGTGAATTSQGFVFAGPSSGAGAPAFRALAAADLPAEAKLWSELSGNVYRGGGNVGIGTSAPTLPLDVTVPTSVTAGNHDISRTGDSNNGLRTGFLANGTAVTASYIRSDNGLPLALGTTATIGNGGAVSITNAGNVGIGTVNPLMKFAVQGTTGYPTTTGTTPVGIARFEGTLNNNVLDLGKADAAPWGMWLQATNRTDLSQAYPIILNPNGGYVGIGTTSPKETLQVGSGGHALHTGGNLVHLFNGYYSPANSRFEYGGYTGGSKYSAKIDFSPTTGIFQIATSSNSGIAGDAPAYDGGSLTLMAGGNVGIGTTNPTQKLEVNGAIKATSFIGPVTAASAANTAGYNINSDSDSAGSDGGVNIQVRGSTKLAVTDAGRVAVGGVVAPVSLLANTSTNATDVAGTGSSPDSISWLTNAAGYVASFVNSSSASNANGLFVKTTGTAATNRILNLNANGVDVMTVTGGGSIGIGTTNPGNLLETAKTDTGTTIGAGTAGYRIRNSSNAANTLAEIQFAGSGGNDYASISGVYANSADNTQGHIAFATRGASTDVNLTERVRNLANGNVGIGTSAPSYTFDTPGTARIATYLLTPHVGTASGNLLLDTSSNTSDIILGNSYMTVKSGGKIGIGTTAPTGNLHVFNKLTGNADGIVVENDVSTNPNQDGPYLTFQYDEKTASPVETGDVMGGIRFRSSYLADTYSGVGASIKGIQDGTVSSTSSPGALLFSTTADGTTTLTERMRISNTGLVGVGTTTPTAKLDVTGGNIALNPSDANTGVASPDMAQGLLRFNNRYDSTGNQTTNKILLYDAPGTNRYGIGISSASFDLFAGASGGFNFYTGHIDETNPGSSKMTITNAGWLGIGTSNPISKLNVRGGFVTVDNPGNGTGGTKSDVTNDGGIRLIRPLDATSPTVNGYIDFYGSSSTAYNRINFEEANNRMWFTNNSGAKAIFSGPVGIGISSPTYTLHVNGSVAGTSAYNNLSDARLKTNIAPVYDALDRLMKVRGVTFDWRQDIKPDWKLEKTRDMGVIAQEVEAIFPEAVVTDKDGFKSVAYSKLIAPLIEAVRELSSKSNASADAQNRAISSLKDQNLLLQKQNESLQKENGAIRAYLCKKDPHAGFCD